MAIENAPVPPQVTSTRDSFLREITRAPIDLAVRGLEYLDPHLSADKITAAGVGGAILAGELFTLRQQQMIEDRHVLPLAVPSAVMVGSFLCDALDGYKAHKDQGEGNGHNVSKHGYLYDPMADRIRETVLGITKMNMLYQQGDMTGFQLAALSTGINIAPSIMRAWVEAQRGLKVSEIGAKPDDPAWKKALQMPGTSVLRSVSIMSTLIAPKIGDFPVQHWLDGVNLGANLFTALERGKMLLEPEDPSAQYLSPELKEKARKRLIALGGLAVLTTGATVATYYGLTRQEKK